MATYIGNYIYITIALLSLYISYIAIYIVAMQHAGTRMRCQQFMLARVAGTLLQVARI